jgi:hypothetical protein
MEGAQDKPEMVAASANRHPTTQWNLLKLSIVTICAIASGCTYHRLENNTVKQAETVVDLQYRQILDNLAMFRLNPDTLPSLVTLKTGASQVGDSGSAGFLGTSGLINGSGTVFSTFGSSPTLTGTRTIVDQWGSSPVTDDNNLMLLSKAFRCALGYKDLIDEDDANDLAHDLNPQIGTTTDMSVDRDTLGTIFGQNLVSGALSRLMPPDPARRNPPPRTTAAEALHRAQSRELQALAQRLAEVNELIDENITDTLDHVILAKSYAFSYSRRLDAALVNDPKDIPAKGKDSVWVAPEDTGYLFCIFGGDGKRHTFRLTPSPRNAADPTAEKIKDLREEWDGKWPPHELDASEKREIIERVAEVTGLKSSLKVRFEPVKDSSTGLAKETIYRLNDAQKTLDEIPSGWLRWGPKKPKDACYVGHACFCGQQCYVWVCSDGLDGLSRFTRAVLKLGSTFKDVQVVTAPSGIQFAPALTNTPR